MNLGCRSVEHRPFLHLALRGPLDSRDSLVLPMHTREGMQFSQGARLGAPSKAVLLTAAAEGVACCADQII